MSVLIKDMKIPKSCFDCPLYDDEESFCKAQNEFLNLIISDRDRAISCPLVDLSKHGDLIDRDELKKEFPKDADWEYPVNTNEYVCEMIDKAKKVIEAEE